MTEEKALKTCPVSTAVKGNNDVRGRTPAGFQGKSGAGRSFPPSDSHLQVLNIWTYSNKRHSNVLPEDLFLDYLLCLTINASSRNLYTEQPPWSETWVFKLQPWTHTYTRTDVYLTTKDQVHRSSFQGLNTEVQPTRKPTFTSGEPRPDST